MQGLNIKTWGDILLVNLASALLILVITFFPNSPVRIILGLPFVLFYTGYVSISALFPKKEELDIIERLAFSIGLSIAIIALMGLLLNNTSFGISVYSVAFTLISFILLVSIVAIYRRRTTPSGDVFAPLAPDGDKKKFDAVQREECDKEVGYEKIKLEYLALPFFIVIILFFYHQKYFSYIFMAIGAAIGALLFIIFNKYFAREQELNPSFVLPDDKSHTLRLVTSILFCIFYGLSFLALLQGFYTKTVWYYILISLCAGVIAVEILFVKTKTQGTINLIKSFLLVLNITLSNQIVFTEGITLQDFGYHTYKMVLPIINNGFIPTIGASEYFPSHHILVAANILICGSDPKWTYIYLAGILISLGMLFLFIIGRKYINLKYGLFIALLYPCLDYFMRYGTHPVHQSYNYFFSIMLFVVILYVYAKRDPRFAVFFPIFVTLIVFTHHYSSITLLAILTSLVIVEIFQRIKEPSYQFRFFGLFQIYVAILLIHWIYYSYLFGSLVGIIKAYHSAIAKGAESFIEATAYDQLPIRTLFLNTLGSSILIALSVIGFLYFLKKRSFFMGFIIMVTICLTLLLGIGVVFSKSELLPDRMYPFLQVFGLVFLGSAGIMWLVDNVKIKKNRLKLISIVVLIMCLLFFSQSSTIVGFETSLFVDEHTAYYKLYDTPQDSYFKQWKASNIRNELLFCMDTGLEEDLNKRRVGLTGKLEKEFESRGVALPGGYDVRKEEDNRWIIVHAYNTPYIVIKEEGHLNVYKIIKICNVPITVNGAVDVKNIVADSFIIFNKFHLKTGYPIALKGHLGCYTFKRINEAKLYALDRYDKCYSNGMLNLYMVQI